MSSKKWLAAIVVTALVIIVSLAKFCWFQTHEYVAIWLEGIALVFIFGLDFFERKAADSERATQHNETMEQLKISRQQTEAATEAALAAKKSADILASLHRPLMGLLKVSLVSGLNTRYWKLRFTIKNYGTLSAINVGTTIEFFIDGALRGNHSEPSSTQLFPTDEYAIQTTLDLGDHDVDGVHQETKKLVATVRIPYQSEDGRKSEYTAEASYTQGQFGLDKSETQPL